MPSLDGVRALSIALVLFGHELHFSAARRIGDLANLGVRSFFVLSGFLITTLLLEEYRANKRISLRNFYARRALRIFPAAYAFMLVLFALERFGFVAPIDLSSWIHAVTYTTDYQSLLDRNWNLGHLWSLAVEEQFYLIWPTVLVLLRPRKALWSAFAVICVVPLMRLATWRFFPAYVNDMKWQFHTVCDALATGCVLAGIREVLWERPVYRRLMGSTVFVLVPVGVLFLNWAIVGRPRVNYLLGQTTLNFGIALCIDFVLRNYQGLAGRVLNLPPVGFVGTLSYSMYLWQQIFFNPDVSAWIGRFPFNVAGTAVAAFLSYRLIETPFLSMRHRFGSPQASRRAARAVSSA